MLSQLDLSLGALEIGVLLSSTLWGVTTVQFYIYLTAPNKDPWWTKALVYIVWILESLHTIFAWAYIYRLTVTFYGVPAALAADEWTLSASSLFDGIIGAIVQMFFAYRVRMFSNSWAITSVVWVGSLFQLACTLSITILTPRFSIAEFALRFGWLFEAALATNLIVDVINTGALSYYLSRGRTGFKSTDRVLEKLVTWTVETGLITAIAAALQLAFLKALPNTALWIGISLFYAKLYSNSFLAILNSRSILRQGYSTTQPQTTSGISGFSRSWNTGTTQSGGVHVNVVQGHDNDLELESVKDTVDKRHRGL
ncbi:hypothetical protein C8R44DRAFT_233603 [Mycena epipterygia]|nr:hypothetical protein C8R44DRAFT_233603 [Mycena epipterygia]